MRPESFPFRWSNARNIKTASNFSAQKAQCASVIAAKFCLATKDDKDWREIEVEFDEPLEDVADTGFSRGFMSFAPKIIEAIREGKTEIENAATFRRRSEKFRKFWTRRTKSDETGKVVKL